MAGYQTSTCDHQINSRRNPPESIFRLWQYLRRRISYARLTQDQRTSRGMVERNDQYRGKHIYGREVSHSPGSEQNRSPRCRQKHSQNRKNVPRSGLSNRSLLGHIRNLPPPPSQTKIRSIYRRLRICRHSGRLIGSGQRRRRRRQSKGKRSVKSGRRVERNGREIENSSGES